VVALGIAYTRYCNKARAFPCFIAILSIPTTG
jgi:hypothetical protein